MKLTKSEKNMVKYLLVVMIMMLFTVIMFLLCSMNKRKEAAFLFGWGDDDDKNDDTTPAPTPTPTPTPTWAPSEYQLEKAFMFADESLNQYLTKLPVEKAEEMVRAFMSDAVIPAEYANEHAYLFMFSQTSHSARIIARLAHFVEYFELARDLIAEENLENAASDIQRIDDYLSILTPKVTQFREALERFFSIEDIRHTYRPRLDPFTNGMQVARELHRTNPNNTILTENPLVYTYVNVFDEGHVDRQSLIYKMHIKHGLLPSTIELSLR